MVRPRLLFVSLQFLFPADAGGGARSKIYEAMAMRRPVVSTSISVEGLPIKAGEHYRRADTASAFAEAVLQLLAALAEGAEMAENAYVFILKRYSTWRVAGTFEDICKRTAGSNGAIEPPNPRRWPGNQHLPDAAVAVQ